MIKAFLLSIILIVTPLYAYDIRQHPGDQIIEPPAPIVIEIPDEFYDWTAEQQRDFLLIIITVQQNYIEQYKQYLEGF